MLKQLVINSINRIEYWFPILLLILINTDYFFLNDILANVLLAILLVCFTTLFRKIKSVYIPMDILCGIVFNIMMGIQLGHFYLFDGNLRASTFFIVFDTNNSEAFDFFNMYLNTALVLLFSSLFIGVLLGVWFKIKSKFYFKEKGFSKRKWIVLGLIISTLFFIKEVRRKVFPYSVYNSFVEYSTEKQKFDAVTQDPLGGVFSDVKQTSDNEDEVYVLIIGESTTRHHMQLYNYNRPTNPQLSKIKEDLVVFQDVISPHTRTLESLGKVLTLASFEEPNRKFDGTIIQLFNKAGFNTYWISNQRPVGIFDTETTVVAKNCKKSIFVGTQGEREISLDERVIPPFEKILKEEKGKKLIVLHLMGTHVQYKKRYPNSFTFFKGESDINFPSKKAFKITNQYDDAVLYNDYVVSEVINTLNKYIKDKEAFVLYFSDHGEEIYQSIDLAGHNDEHCTKSMYDIPFILWQSPKYKQTHSDFVYDINRPYITEDMIYTLSDLSGVYFKEFDSTKSIVNKNFLPKKRRILEGVDYNEHFKVKN